jgi:hypothetical protein
LFCFEKAKQNLSRRENRSFCKCLIYHDFDYGRRMVRPDQPTLPLITAMATRGVRKMDQV